MKKLSLILAALLLCALFLGVPVLADEEEVTMGNVTDVADLLTGEEWRALETRAQSMTETYGCQVLIVTWDELGEDYDTCYALATDLFNWYDLGYGEDRSCVMLFLSYEDSKCCMFTNGFGSTAVSLDEEDRLLDVFIEAEGGWAASFDAYLDALEADLAKARGTTGDTAGQSVTAAQPATAAQATGTLDYVTDAAELLTENQRAELNRRAAALTEKYGLAVRILTVPSIGNYNIEDFAEAAFDQYGLGYGADGSMVMLLLSMEYRDYDIMAHGYGNYAFTDYGKDKLADRFLPKLGNNDWYGGFTAYLDGCEEFLEKAAQGEPVDVGSSSVSRGTKTVIHLLIALIPAFIVVLIMKGKMKTVAKQRTAAEYTGWDQLDLRLKEDRFLHRSVRRTKIESSSGGSRSGGGTSVNSHGSSHHSGKF